MNAPATDSASDDIEVIGDTLISEEEAFSTSEDNSYMYWNTTAWVTNVASVAAGADGKSITISFGTNALGEGYASSIFLDKDKSGFALENGKSYKIAFKIKSSVARDVWCGFDDDGTDKVAHQYSLSANTETSVAYNITTTGEWNKFMFYMGAVGNTPNDIGEHSITISEFSIKEVSIKPAPGPEVEDPEDNILKNGTFENGSLDGWGTVGSCISNDNIVAFDIKTNDAAWTTRLYQENVTLTNGSKYKIAFDVTSSVDRYIIYGFDNTYWMPYLQLNANETKHVEYVVTGTAGGTFAIFLGSNLDRSSIAYTNENGETVTDTPFNQTLDRIEYPFPA